MENAISSLSIASPGTYVNYCGGLSTGWYLFTSIQSQRCRKQQQSHYVLLHAALCAHMHRCITWTSVRTQSQHLGAVVFRSERYTYWLAGQACQCNAVPSREFAAAAGLASCRPRSAMRTKVRGITCEPEFTASLANCNSPPLPPARRSEPKPWPLVAQLALPSAATLRGCKYSGPLQFPLLPLKPRPQSALLRFL